MSVEISQTINIIIGDEGLEIQLSKQEAEELFEKLGEVLEKSDERPEPSKSPDNIPWYEPTPTTPDNPTNPWVLPKSPWGPNIVTYKSSH